ncbi:MAG: hypothetical protein K6F53_11535 [Lachnospiraceae bacterium]|nr:hypothetical protein [Lachnospiraceae bacterium]
MKKPGLKNHNLNGYLTTESSFVFSMCILLYFLIIMAGLLLFARCLTSQNDYIIGMRGARFTEAGDAYGEVIYGMERFDARPYMMERLRKAGQSYIVYRQSTERAAIDAGAVRVRTTGGGRVGRNICDKRIGIVNPIEGIRAERGGGTE